MKLIAITNDPRLLAEIEQIAAARGWPLRSAATGNELLSAHGREPADVMIVDGRVAQAGGAAALCRQVKALAGPPTIVLALVDAADDPVEVLEAGADDLAPVSVDGATLGLRLLALARRVAGAIFEDESAEPQRLEALAAETLLRVVPGSFTLIDRDLHLVAFNETAYQTAQLILGRPLAPGESVLDCAPADARGKLRELLARAFGGESLRIERPARSASGGSHWFEITLEPVLAPGGPVEAVAMVAVDIDGRRKAIDALARNEARFRSLVAHSSDLTTVIATDGTIIYASPAARQVIGRPVESIIGTNGYDLIHPDDLPALRAIASKMGASHRLNVRLRHADGSWRQVDSVLTNLLDDPAVGAIVCNSRDITERLDAEEALRDSEQRFSLVFHSSPTAMCLAAPRDGRFFDANEAFLALVGYQRAELLGRTSAELGLWEEPRIVDALGEEVRSSGAVRHPEIRYRTHDGELREGILTLERMGTGSLDSLLVVLEDTTERTRAVAALRQSEERFRGIVETAEEGVWTLDTQYRTVFVNQKMARMLGYNVADMAGRHINDFAFPEDHESAAVYLAKRKKGERGQGDARFRRSDGTPLWVIISAAPLHDANGRIVGVLGMFTDITERRLSEGALRDSEEKLSTTLNSIGEAVISTDDRGCVARMNPVAEALVGRTFAEVDGKPLAELFHLVDQTTGSAMPSLVEEALRGGAGVKAQATLLTRDGRGRPVAASAAPISDARGAISGVVLVLRDMSEERRSEEALRRSEATFRTLIECTPDSVFVDRGGRLAYANPAMLALLGYDHADELLGSDPLLLAHPDDRVTAATRRREVSQAGRAQATGERRFLRKDGGIVLVEVTAVPVMFDGQPSRVVILRDITERKQMQVRLALADRMVSVGTLAAGVAHEVNNPLAYLTANLRYIAEELTELGGALPEARARELVDAIHDAQEGAERVRLIVRDLKTFSRGDEEHVPGSGAGAIDVRRSVESAVNLAWNEIRHRARLVKDFGEVPAVDANEGRLGQVFLNLLINAAQAISEGEADRNEIRVSTWSDDSGRAVIEVRDSGEGITPENLARIFDPFFTTRPVGVGSGLGLCICHGIVSGLGGEITVESERGKGSAFRVVLPAATHSEVRPARTRGEPTPRRARILVVDDEPLILTSVKRLLGPDHDVVPVPSARDALSQLDQGSPFDVILCDLMMPEMTGMDLHAELLARLPEVADKMVFLTGGAFTARARAFLDQVPNVRLEKPFDGQNLRAVISDMLR